MDAPTEPLTTLTVNCTPRTMDALDRATEATGDTKADTMNRAAQIYAILVNLKPGEGFRFQKCEGGEWVSVARLDLIHPVAG